MSNQKTMKVAGVLLLSALMLFSASAVTANTTKQSLSITKYTGHGSSSFVPTMDDAWLHYDDGTCVNSIGLTSGGTFEGAIRLTPTELGPYNGWYLTEIKFFHGAPGYDQPSHSGMIKIYGAQSATHPGTLITSEPYTTPEGADWFEVPLSSPVTIDATHDYWFSVQITHAAGEYPLGVDAGPAVDGKGDWVSTGGSWIELQTIPLDYNWCIYGKVSTELTDIIPPTTTCTLNGVMQGGVYITDVTATLTATDAGSGVNYTMYKVDSGGWNTYTGPFLVNGNGVHTIHYYSVDNVGNIEAEKTTTFTIQYPIQITIKGGLGITATIKNNGTTDLIGAAWSIDVSGGIILVGKSKTGTANIAAGSSVTEKDLVIGFGKPTITVTVGDVSATATGTVLLFFVLGVQ
jgi:hypothetical protein